MDGSAMAVNDDGTRIWPEDMSPVDRLVIAMAEVSRARIHLDAAIHAHNGEVDRALKELGIAIRHVEKAAKGDHT